MSQPRGTVIDKISLIPQCVSNHAWLKGMNRLERLAGLGKASKSLDTAPIRMVVREGPLAEHLESFSNFQEFDVSRKADLIPEDVLEALTGVSTEDLQSCGVEPPSWHSEFIRAFLYARSESTLSSEVHHQSKPMFGFLRVFSPVITRGLADFKQGLADVTNTTPHAPFVEEKVTESLFNQILTRIENIISRTMVLELNVERLKGQLSGETPEERFASFLERISDPLMALELLQEYPVLCRQVTIAVRQWVETSLELIGRLCKDWQLILGTFKLEDSAKVIRIETNAGDSHQNGRTVAFLVFSSGVKLVYKPRSMAVDVHFQELLTWVNERGDHPPFKTTSVINRDSYGWSEFVEPKPCSTPSELERFYERQGGYLALLYALNATDFHSENLIAAGEHPVLIDLESLFHAKPSVPFHTSSITDVAATVLAESVLRVGLLPQRIWGDKHEEGLDLSGLGGAAGQRMPFRVPGWNGVGTDEMRFERQYAKFLGNKNRPALAEQDVDVLEFVDNIIKGFEAIYTLLVNCRNDLLDKHGPIENFANDEIRYIARATRFYAINLMESFHPDFLRDALDRDNFFDYLKNATSRRPDLARLIRFEREDLWRNDIPFFTSKPNSLDLRSSTKDLIQGFFETTSLDAVKKNLQELNEDDCSQQCWIIRSSLATFAMGEPTASWKSYSLEEPKPERDQECFLRTAKQVGDRLLELAFRGKKEATWIGVSMINDRFWQVSPMNLGLYDGVAGVTLFLSYLGSVVNEGKYTRVAEEAAFYINKQWQHYKDVAKESPQLVTPLPIGAFSHSPVSAIHLLTHLGHLWNAEELLHSADSLVEILPQLIMQDEIYDVISGAAGCIKVLLNLQLVHPSDRTIELALACGDVLLERAVPMDAGIAWKTLPGSEQPLLGFSHGAAGIAWALMHLGYYTGEPRYIEGAMNAIAYERTLFDPEVGNWPDLRQDAKKHQARDSKKQPSQPTSLKFMTAWCHGAPGIGLSRLDLLKYNKDADMKLEVEAAIKMTQASGFGQNHCLCHGDLGNLELLFSAAKDLGYPTLDEESQKIFTMILNSIDRHGWLCGVPLSVETPGLMTGISGIGYQALRFTAGDKIPSILLLEPPFTGEGA